MRLRIAVLLACAGLAANVSAQSATCPTQPPQLNEPSNGASNVASPVHFDWNDVPNATSYRVWGSFAGGTPNIIALTRDSEASLSVPAGVVEWWVDALALGCSTLTTSSHFRFTAVGGTMNCPQNPSSPTLLTPANATASLTSPVTLSWSAVPNATGYRVFAQVNGAAAVVIGTTSSTQLSAPFPAANVTWFVEAMFGACPSTFSRFGTFTVTTGASCNNNTPATLVAPANGATVTAPVTFRWSAVPGATSYKLFIGSDLAGTTTDTTLTKLLGDGTFNWYVVTTFASCPDQQSATSRLTVPPAATCSGSITLTSPSENATVASPANLTWTPVANATAYRVWVSIDGSAPTILARTAVTTQSLFTPSGNIAWFVEALFAQCPSILSPTGHFIVGRGATCGVNSAPVPTSPINGAQAQSPVTFTWSGASNAMLFRLWVSVNGAPFEDVGITKEAQLKTDVPGGNVQWYVEAFFNGCPSVSSTTASFTIPQTNGCANATSILISPADGSSTVTAPVTLVWSAVDNATNYRVFATLNGSPATVIARSDGTSVTKSLPPGSISWWVEAEFDECASTKSLHSSFVIARSASCGTDVPQLVAPPSAATNVASPVKLDWNPVSGAVDYAVFLRHNGGPPTAIADTTETDLTRRLPEGSFEWWVVALFAGCPAVESGHATFTIPQTTCSNRPPILMGPADGTTGLTSPVHMKWSAVPHATGYKVWAAADDGGDPSVIASTTTNSLTTTMPSGEVDWFVEAQFANCPSVNSATAGFTVRKNAPACGTPTKPIARAPGQVASGTPFTIHWSAVANATNYELLESTSANFNGRPSTARSAAARARSTCR